jgi:hypothetical protein
MADDVDLAFVGLDDPGEDLEEGALAGPVGPDDRQALAVDDPETDVTERPEMRRPVAATQQIPERGPNGRLAGQAQVVADAHALRIDRVGRLRGLP